MEKVTINGYVVILFPSGEEGSPCVIVMGGEDESGRYEQITALVREELSFAGKKASLCYVFVNDWDGQLSPWEARGAGQDFSGRGEETLSFLENELKDHLASSLGNVPLMIAGYSLAGMFSLWAYLKSGAFSACASCSGSLWFPGFEEMVTETPLRQGSAIYLSLGGKESSTPDPLMATVGEVHERLYRFFRSDPAVTRVRYDKNPGGHFRDPDKRLAKGIVWMAENV